MQSKGACKSCYFVGIIERAGIMELAEEKAQAGKTFISKSLKSYQG